MSIGGFCSVVAGIILAGVCCWVAWKFWQAIGFMVAVIRDDGEEERKERYERGEG